MVGIPLVDSYLSGSSEQEVKPAPIAASATINVHFLFFMFIIVLSKV
jgi:hypothetical protein